MSSHTGFPFTNTFPSELLEPPLSSIWDLVELPEKKTNILNHTEKYCVRYKYPESFCFLLQLKGLAPTLCPIFYDMWLFYCIIDIYLCKKDQHILQYGIIPTWLLYLPLQITPAPSFPSQLSVELCAQSSNDVSVPSHITSSRINSEGTCPNCDELVGTPDEYLAMLLWRTQTYSYKNIPEHTASNSGILLVPHVVAHRMTIQKHIAFSGNRSTAQLYLRNRGFGAAFYK